MRHSRIILSLQLLALWCVAGSVFGVETALDRYVAKPDPEFKFTQLDHDRHTGYDNYFLYMWSQRWRSSTEVDRTIWGHEVSITVPWTHRLVPKTTAFLIVNGGRNSSLPSTTLSEAIPTLAMATNTVIVMVNQVPNQPLYFSDDAGMGRKEDEIIAYSLDKFLRTGDGEWPVLLPMTKAVVRAMDTVQQFLETRDVEIHDFVVGGGSKRGWTTWLTAAVDERVKAIMPVSIDILNLDAQIRHHYESYGFYSEAIKDYRAFDIFCRSKGSAGARLRKIIDPYEYRNRLTMPKLVVNSAGDDFFLPDSSRFYYRRLRGDDRLRYTFNTDHGQGDTDIILSAMTWLDDALQERSPPRYHWTVEPDGRIVVQTYVRPKSVRLWAASNPLARDFRLSSIGEAWASRELRDLGGGTYAGKVPKPPLGWSAYSIELTFPNSNGLPLDHVYTTDVVVTRSELPYSGKHCVTSKQEIETKTSHSRGRALTLKPKGRSARFVVTAVNTGKKKSYKVSVDTHGLAVKARVCVLVATSGKCLRKPSSALRLKMKPKTPYRLQVQLTATDILPDSPQLVQTRFADKRGLAHGLSETLVKGR